VPRDFFQYLIEVGRVFIAAEFAGGFEKGLELRQIPGKLPRNLFIERHGESRFDTLDDPDARPVKQPCWLAQGQRAALAESHRPPAASRNFVVTGRAPTYATSDMAASSLIAALSASSPFGSCGPASYGFASP
jgi:hypothetical protein